MKFFFPTSQFFIFLFLILLGSQSIEDKCIDDDCDCDVPCSDEYPLKFDTVHLLLPELVADKHMFFLSNYKAAVEIFEEYEYRKHDTWFMTHTALDYFCCHNESQQMGIVEVLRKLQWQSFNITLSHAICNKAKNGHVSVIIIYDDNSQEKLFEFVHKAEKAIIQAGIPVNHPRHFPFHVTIGQVYNSDDATNIIDRINQNIAVWQEQPFKMNFFLLGPDMFLPS